MVIFQPLARLIKKKKQKFASRYKNGDYSVGKIDSFSRNKMWYIIQGKTIKNFKRIQYACIGKR